MIPPFPVTPRTICCRTVEVDIPPLINKIGLHQILTKDSSFHALGNRKTGRRMHVAEEGGGLTTTFSASRSSLLSSGITLFGIAAECPVYRETKGSHYGQMTVRRNVVKNASNNQRPHPHPSHGVE